jgi:hypothetical protein
MSERRRRTRIGARSPLTLNLDSGPFAAPETRINLDNGRRKPGEQSPTESALIFRPRVYCFKVGGSAISPWRRCDLRNTHSSALCVCVGLMALLWCLEGTE